jgi:hypothetical protein
MRKDAVQLVDGRHPGRFDEGMQVLTYPPVSPRRDLAGGRPRHAAIMACPPSDDRREVFRLPDLLDADTIIARFVPERDDVRPVACRDGRVLHGECWVPVSRAQEPIAARLVEHLGDVVSYADMKGMLPQEPVARRSLLQRLRRKLARIDLELALVRSRGCVLLRVGDHVEPPSPVRG